MGRRCTVVVVGLMMLGCSSGSTDKDVVQSGVDVIAPDAAIDANGGDEVDSTVPGISLAEVPTGGCGAPPYDWVDPSTLGEVLEVEHLPELSMTATNIETLLDVAGIGGFSPIPYDAVTYRIRYTTQDRGQVVEATALVSFPVLTESQNLPGCVWLHPTTGMEDFCAPSGRGVIWGLPVVTLAAMGQAVVAPDYIGQNGFGEECSFKHPYLVGESAAVGTLDSIRALWNLSADAKDELNAVVSHTVSITGGSQGGGVAMWTDLYAAAYLPEVTIDAVVAIAPILDLQGIMESSSVKLEIAGAGLAMVMALARDWYQSDAPLEEVLQAEAIPQLVEIMDTECPKSELPEGITDANQVFQQTLLDSVINGEFETVQPWHCFLETNSFSRSEIVRHGDAPVLYVTGELDDVALAPVQRADLPALCAKGYEIEHVECAGADHAGCAQASLGLAWAWLQDRRAGIPLDPERICKVAAAGECSVP